MIVPIGGVHRAVIEALRYASALAKDVRAVYVNVNPESLVQLKKDWPTWGSHVKLVVLQSPYRSMTEPLLDYIDRMEKEHPDDYITVVLPEFVVKHWWHHLLHNQSALTLKAALLFRPRVVTTSVPFHLKHKSTVHVPKKLRRKNQADLPLGFTRTVKVKQFLLGSLRRLAAAGGAVGRLRVRSTCRLLRAAAYTWQVDFSMLQSAAQHRASQQP